MELWANSNHGFGDRLLDDNVKNWPHCGITCAFGAGYFVRLDIPF